MSFLITYQTQTAKMERPVYTWPKTTIMKSYTQTCFSNRIYSFVQAICRTAMFKVTTDFDNSLVTGFHFPTFKHKIRIFVSLLNLIQSTQIYSRRTLFSTYKGKRTN